MQTEPTTQVLVFLLRTKKKPLEIALARKLRGPEGEKWVWSGYNMLPKKREPDLKAAIRVLAEQAAVEADVRRTHKHAHIEFCEGGGSLISRAHIYLCYRWIGTPKGTESMGQPNWFTPYKIPFQETFGAYRLFLPHILAGEKIVCRFALNEIRTKVTKSSTRVVTSF